MVHKTVSQAQRLTPVIPVLGKLKQKDGIPGQTGLHTEFQANLKIYTETSFIEKVW